MSQWVREGGREGGTKKRCKIFVFEPFGEIELVGTTGKTQRISGPEDSQPATNNQQPAARILHRPAKLRKVVRKVRTKR